MPETDKRKRSAPISYRPPKAMRDEFARRVAASGMSANAFITRSIFDRDPPRQVRRAPVNTVEIARLVGACARLRDALRTVDAAADDAAAIAILSDMQRQLTEIRTACFEALGRSARIDTGVTDRNADRHDGQQHRRTDDAPPPPPPERRPS